MLLTILIPTFNRSSYLKRLLDQIARESEGIEHLLKVIVLDNCSSDDTEQLSRTAVLNRGNWHVVRHSMNIGPDRNFLRSIELVETKYFWMIGDDDIPRTGALKLIIDLLISQQPSLVYLGAIGKPEVSADCLPALTSITPVKNTAKEFAEAINIFTTFISAWIVNRDELVQLGVTSKDIASGIGTYLIQLGWILPLIQRRSVLIQVPDTCLLATNNDNWGGFSFLETFCINYPLLVKKAFAGDPELRSALIVPYLRQGMPQRIRGLREGLFGTRFKKEKFVPIRAAFILGHYKSFWTHCLPAFYPLFGKLIMPGYTAIRFLVSRLKPL